MILKYETLTVQNKKMRLSLQQLFFIYIFTVFMLFKNKATQPTYCNFMIVFWLRSVDTQVKVL